MAKLLIKTNFFAKLKENLGLKALRSVFITAILIVQSVFFIQNVLGKNHDWKSLYKTNEH